MKESLAALAFTAILIPVNISIHDYPLWAGAAFGAWGWIAVITLRWSLR